MREMKDSGIEWVGQIPKDWQLIKGKYIFTQRNTRGNEKSLQLLSPTQKYGVIPQDLYEELSGMNAVKLNEKTNLALLKTIHSGDYCISLRSFQGGFEYSEYEGVVSPAYQVFYDVVDTAKGYYKYLFKDMSFIEKMNSYTMSLRDGKNIAFSDFGRTYIPYPSVGEQKRIADFLDAKCSEIDALTADIEKQIETLEEYKQSVIKEVFDSFMKSNKFVYAKLGNLSGVVTKQTGFDYTNIISPSLVGELTEDTIPYLQTRHFKDNSFNYKTEYYIPKKIAKLFPKIVLNDRCLLFSIVGASIGNVAVYPGEKLAFLGGAICKVTLLNDSFYDYIKHYMMSIYGQQQIKIRINSSAQGTITVQNVRDFKIPLFENKTIHEKVTNQINRVSAEIYQLIDDKRKQVEVLENYKKSLIYEYVTGKKEVPAT